MKLDYEELIAWCRRRELDFHMSPERREIAVPYPILGRSCHLLLIPYPSRHMTAFALRLPFEVEDDRHPYVARALNRLNATCFMGTWVLDGERGVVYFRVTLPTLDNLYGDQGLFFAARVVVTTVEECAQGLERIATGETDALEPGEVTR